jgi:hypothetical protein
VLKCDVHSVFLGLLYLKLTSELSSNRSFVRLEVCVLACICMYLMLHKTWECLFIWCLYRLYKHMQIVFHQNVTKLIIVFISYYLRIDDVLICMYIILTGMTVLIISLFALVCLYKLRRCRYLVFEFSS